MASETTWLWFGDITLYFRVWGYFGGIYSPGNPLALGSGFREYVMCFLEFLKQIPKQSDLLYQWPFQKTKIGGTYHVRGLCKDPGIPFDYITPNWIRYPAWPQAGRSEDGDGHFIETMIFLSVLKMFNGGLWKSFEDNVWDLDGDLKMRGLVSSDLILKPT